MTPEPSGPRRSASRSSGWSIAYGFVRCPLCREHSPVEDMVGGVCLTCADAIAFAQNARRGAVIVAAPSTEPALAAALRAVDPYGQFHIGTRRVDAATFSRAILARLAEYELLAESQP